MSEHGQNKLKMHLRHGKFEIFHIIGLKDPENHMKTITT